jgi:hypothetical protein
VQNINSAASAQNLSTRGMRPGIRESLGRVASVSARTTLITENGKSQNVIPIASLFTPRLTISYLFRVIRVFCGSNRIWYLLMRRVGC